MFRPRVIPVLLLKNKGLVKSVCFKNHQYIGDPINAVKIFNDSKSDELVFLDITATGENRLISLDFVKNVGEEANMPFAVGGGIRSLSDIEKVIKAGAEKAIICSYAIENPDFIKEASTTFGASTIVVCMDVKSNFWGKSLVWRMNGSQSGKHNPIEFAKLMEENGAGELIVQSIEKDGTMTGYDLNLISTISKSVNVPVIALGGAGNLNHLKEAYTKAYANGLAAGSLFIYHGTQKGVLINYPSKTELNFNRNK